MTERELHRLGRRILDLISREGLSPAEYDEVEECIELLRRERTAHEAEHRAAHRAAHLADEEGYAWEALPESTRAQFVREIVEKDWLETGLARGLTESPFPPIDDDTSR